MQILKDSMPQIYTQAPLSIGSAYLTLETLQNLKRPGMDGLLSNIMQRKKIAWKSGTSYGLRDAWAIGTTPEYTVGVWAGNATGEGAVMLTGTHSAAPVLLDVFSLLKGDSWFIKPLDALKKVSVCKEDGYLATQACQPIEIDMPIKSNFTQISPYRELIHTDIKSGLRVNSLCENVNNMQEKYYFNLPPNETYYYKKINTEYKIPPQWRDDCQEKYLGKKRIIEINYPKKGHSVYLPQGLDGKFKELLLQARHKNQNATLYWHIDNKYLGQTHNIHDVALFIQPGKHKLLVMDKDGNRQSLSFNVLRSDGSI